MILSQMMRYLFTNFVTLDELAKLSNLPSASIQYMIENKLIPDYSYAIGGDLFLENYVNGTQQVSSTVEYYYHKTNVIWVNQAENLLRTNDISEAQKIVFTDFKECYLKLLNKNKSTLFNYNNLFDDNNLIIIDKFDPYFAEIYKHWLKGTFGICVKAPDKIENIFYKEYYQTILNTLTCNGSKTNFTKHESLQTKDAIFNYAKYVSDFSPIDYGKSSKKRFVDDLLHTLDPK